MDNPSWSKRILSAGLTLGASLVLGLLSFAGFYTIVPILPLAMTSFVLATVYEGEIYHQNIYHALQKLFDKDYFKQSRANDLLAKLALDSHIQHQRNHQFFKDYAELHAYVEALSLKKKLDASQKAELKQARKRLALMQRYFKKLVFHGPSKGDTYGEALKAELDKSESPEDRPDNIVNDTERKLRFMRWGLVLSVAAGVFVGVGTAGLLIESFSTIAFLTVSSAVLPYAVIPLAALAAAGYFYLTYNSITDMIWNETLQKWYQEVKQDIKKSGKVKAITLAIVSALLVVMSFSLALCTAGTWWTVVKSNPKLLSLLTRIPHTITAVLVTVFGGISQLIFGLENIKETLDTFTELFSGFHVKFIAKYLMINVLRFALRIAITRQNESAWQFYNPFRLILKVVTTPLRILGFAGHIGSIGVTADRVPKVNPFITLILNMMEEIAEDAHYFIPKTQQSAEKLPEKPTSFMQRIAAKVIKLQKEAQITVNGEADCKEAHDEHNHCDDHGHSHGDNDLPTRTIRFALFPLYGLSIAWHKLTSHLTNKTVTWKEAYREAYGIPPDDEHEDPTDLKTPDIHNDFQKAATLMRINEQAEHYHSSDRRKAHKSQAYRSLYEEVRKMESKDLNQSSFQTAYQTPDTADSMNDFRPPIAQILSQHRHTLHHGKTRSEQFIEEIKRDLAAPAA